MDSPAPAPSTASAPPAQPTRAAQATRALPWLVLAGALAGAAFLWRASAADAEHRLMDLLASRADDTVGRIRERLDADRQILLGGVGLIRASGEVSAATWRRYLGALRMDEEYRGIQGVGFARWVPPGGLEAHLRQVRADGDRAYTVRPPGARAGYGPVVILEPASARNQRVIGLDMYEEPTRRAAMDQARDSGAPALTRRVRLDQEPAVESQAGMVLYAPVYRAGLPTLDLEARRAALQGWVFSSIRVGDLVHHTLGDLPEEVAFTIVEPETGALLFASHPGTAHPPRGGRAVRRDLDLFGRRWAFTFVALPGLAGQVGPGRSGVLLAMALGALLTVAAFVVQRRAERQTLAQEAARRRILFDASPDGMVVVDPERAAILEFNTAAHAQLGYTREDFARLTLFDIEAAETPEQTRAHLAELLEAGRADFETRHRTKQGEVRDVHVTAQVVDLMGQRACQCAFRDVTERRNVEAALRDANLQVRVIGDNLPGGYVYRAELAPDGSRRFTYVSAGVEQVHGVTPDEVLLDPMALYGSVPEEHRARLAEEEERSARELTPMSVEIPVRARSGALVWVRLGSAPTRLANGVIRWDGIALDVTDRKRAEADRLVMSKLESTGIFAGGVAHDFNNLLTTVLLGIELVRDEARTGAAREVLENVVEAVTAAQALTRQLITFSAGGKPVRRPVDLAGLAGESARLALRGSTVLASVRAAPGLWPAEVDDAQIGQVVRNLVLNAREAMPGGGTVSITLRNVTLGADAGPELAPGDYVEVAVTDRGGGIAPEVLPRIFDPYFSTKARGSEKGMGLGLTICHSVVKRHGGAISVETTAGEGATFRVLLPAFRGPAAIAAAPSPAAPGAARRAPPRERDQDEERTAPTDAGRAGGAAGDGGRGGGM